MASGRGLYSEGRILGTRRSYTGMRFELRKIAIGAACAGLGLALLSVLCFPSASRAAYVIETAESSLTKLDGSPATEAGTHPYAWKLSFTGATASNGQEEVPTQQLKELRVQLPPGLVGAPAVLPVCPRFQFLNDACPAESAVGEITASFYIEERAEETLPVFSLEPLPGSVAELGFMVPAVQDPGFIRVSVNPDPPYNLEAAISEVPHILPIYGASLTLRGSADGKAFLTLPRSCGRPLATVFEATSLDQPDQWTRKTVEPLDPVDPSASLSLTGCDRLGFAPVANLALTTGMAEAPSGLDLGVDVSDPGLLAEGGAAAADVRDVEVQLPEGMTVNPSVAEGLAVCTHPELAAESQLQPGTGCPESSKVGTAELETPLLSDPLHGSIFAGESLLDFHLVVENPARGVVLTEPISVSADPASGRLSATLADLPEIPISHLELHFRDGPRAPFVTPSACGDHPASLALAPSSGAPALVRSEDFRIDAACGGGSFQPTLSAGTVNPQAGASTSFVFDLRRQDGEEEPRSISLTLPEGVSARLGTMPLCGGNEAAAGECPAASKVGYARVAAGAGSAPAWFPDPRREPGGVFLAGPYEGAPFSLAIALPAQAGPFDLGDVLIRAPIRIDSRTARADVGIGPLPGILEGVPIRYRDLRLVLDRPGFIRNPTSCEPSAVTAAVVSGSGSRATASDRFQVGNCASLRAAPRVSAALLGSSRRGAHPGLRIVVRPRPGEADLRRATVALPPAELLDFRHIGAVCAETAYAAGGCPAASVYGHASVETPLLARPLTGPVYLKQGKGKLPELAMPLEGELALDLRGRLGWRHGRLQAVLGGLPDAPFDRVAIDLLGGRRGLIVNSGGLCAGRPHLAVRFLGHNGRSGSRRLVLRSSCRR